MDQEIANLVEQAKKLDKTQLQEILNERFRGMLAASAAQNLKKRSRPNSLQIHHSPDFNENNEGSAAQKKIADKILHIVSQFDSSKVSSDQKTPGASGSAVSGNAVSGNATSGHFKSAS